MTLSNLRIGARLALGFALTIAIMLAMSLIGISRIQQTAAHTDNIVNDRYAKVALINDMRSQVNRGSQALRNAMLTPDAVQTQEFLRQMADADRLGGEAAQKLGQVIRSQAIKTIFAQQQSAFDAFKVQRDKVIAQYRSGDREGAVQAMFTDVIPTQATYFAKLDELLQGQRALMKSDAQQAADAASSATTLMLVLLVAATVVSIVGGWLIARSVTAPINEAVRMAETVAAGDLTARIVSDRKDETGRLLAALRDMAAALTRTVSTVRDSTDTINTASAEIASGNMDLSRRTEQQAASLEETASSMEELTSTVRQNADNARQANQLVISCADQANEGGQVVSQVVETMGSIKESSGKIVDIIGVIDSIAFQTNILALNAAVEAARAGEQGRGFAVVATEVRNLAHRSATAAKEIKELIHDSVEKVDAGGRLVDQAGVSMERIVASVQQVADIMNEITSASSEQSAGIEQVNTAIVSMDTTTQQNAALVEEAAAAATSMRDQAQRLSDAIAVFRIDGVAAVRAAPAVKPVKAAPAPAAAPRIQAGKPAAKVAAKPVASAHTAKKAPAGDDWEEF